MDELTFDKAIDQVFRAIGDAFENVDPEVVDCDATGDVITLALRGGRKCVVNTQRAVRQIWLAADARAWHFSWDEARRRWMDDKGRGDELYATIAGIVKQTTGADVAIG